MTSDFENKVQLVLSEFLSKNGFKHEQSQDFDGGNETLVVYSSPQCKLRFYRTQRDGEVNCQIGAIGAINLDMESSDWLYLSSLLAEGENLSIEELLANVPEKPKSDEDQLREIGIKLKQNFDDLVKGVANYQFPKKP